MSTGCTKHVFRYSNTLDVGRPKNSCPALSYTIYSKEFGGKYSVKTAHIIYAGA